MSWEKNEGLWDAKEREAQERLRRANGDGRNGSAYFTLVPFDQINLQTTSSYLIKGLIPATGLVVIWGPPKCGKSFWTFDVALHIALGWDYRGRRVRQGPVVYAAMEGRFRLWRAQGSMAPTPPARRQS